MYKIVNGEQVSLTTEEVAEFVTREQEYANEVIQAQAVQYKVLRKNEYPSLEDMLVALIEKEEEGRPDSLNLLMAERQRIKAKYPKPQ